MRLAPIILFALLSGCNMIKSDTVSKCETSIQNGLKAPSTFKLFKSTEYDVPDAMEQIEKLYKGYNIPLPFDNFKEKLPKVIAPYKVVYVEYDANNAFDVPIRNNDACYFGTSSDPSYTTGKPTLMKFLDTQFLQQLSQMK